MADVAEITVKLEKRSPIGYLVKTQYTIPTNDGVGKRIFTKIDEFHCNGKCFHNDNPIHAIGLGYVKFHLSQISDEVAEYLNSDK